MTCNLKINKLNLDKNQTKQKSLEIKQKSLHQQINQARILLNAKKTSQGIDSYFAIATEMVLIGDITKATAIYKLILKEDNNNSLALTFLSNLYHHQGLIAEVQQLNSKTADNLVHSEYFQKKTFLNSAVELSKINELENILPAKEVYKDEIIITQNQENNSLYLITKGQFQILHQTNDGKAKEIATLSTGNFFGELTMLLPHRKATATVVAMEAGKLLVVNRKKFHNFLNSRPGFLESLIKATHKHLLEYTLRPLLFLGNDRDQLWLSRISESFTIKSFSAQELILKEGVRNQSLYVILDGNLEVSCKSSKKDHQLPITILNAGDFFGEFSLLTGEAASATLKALSNGWIACLERQEVNHLAAHFPDFLSRILTSYKERKLNLMKKKISSLNPTKGNIRDD